MAYQIALPWNEGEEEMHRILHVPDRDNPTSPFLTPYGAQILTRSPLLALGTLDAEGRPWTTLWGGQPGFSRPIGQSIIGVKTTIDRIYDPVIGAVVGTEHDGEVVDQDGPGKMVGGLAIDLQTRNRVKLYGRSVASAISTTEPGIGEIQLVVRIEQSLGNCPKYLNKKQIIPTIPQPKLISSTLPLPQKAVDLLAKADLFFISSSNHESDMDTNHRGGPEGFVRLLSNNEESCTIVYPEYSGNRLYQTLGNLRTTPKAGLVFPDFDTGDVLYITGTTEILTGEDATRLLPHTNLAVKIRISAAIFVAKGLSFRGIKGESSPYNPPVRYLTTEQRHDLSQPSDTRLTAKLVAKQKLTPSIARFRFSISSPPKANPISWKAGQYVALSFADELDIGYSHMREDDPKSLNDDYLRTFTISSTPPSSASAENTEFEITIRKVGVVTDFLFRANVRAGLEVPVMGFGGDFFIQQPDAKEKEITAFVAGGIGITPILAQAAELDLEKIKLFWTVRADDLGVVFDSFERIPGLVKATKLFVTGTLSAKVAEKLKNEGVSFENRRLESKDLIGDNEESEKIWKWYLCAGTAFRGTLLKWLEGKNASYEDFNY